MEKIFFAGATGYLGGGLAERLCTAGLTIKGLARSEASATKLLAMGIEPVMGTLEDSEVITQAIANVDTVVNAAASDNRVFVETVLNALAGSGKTYLHTSGASVAADESVGDYSDTILTEDTPFTPHPARQGRYDLEQLILQAATQDICTLVVRPGLVYGYGASVQVPRLIELARKTGTARHVGKGENIWSVIHRDELADLYWLALEKGQAGTLYNAASGEASFKEMAQAVSRMLGLGGQTESMTLEEAAELWGLQSAKLLMACNCRVRAERARQQLGWQPRDIAILQDIEFGSYQAAYAASGLPVT